MAIDWERVVVESDDNGVVVSAGQVSLLIGADADSVSWGNITGDITQQPDLMQIVDGYVSADSPTFTGTPRSVTPPEGNNSTRIATTAYVQGEMANVRRDVSDKVNEAPVNNHIWGRKDENWAQLGEMATVDEPAHGISSSEPQRFMRTKEPDGDMVWEEAGPFATMKYLNYDYAPTMPDIYVDGTNGSDETGTGRHTAPYKTIEKAIHEASSVEKTAIMIEAGYYAPKLIINKPIWLYSLADSPNNVKINEINVVGSRLDIYGRFLIGRIEATEGAFVYNSAETTLTMDGGYNKPIRASRGSVVSLGNVIINPTVNTAFSVERGSIIAVQSVTGCIELGTPDAGLMLVGEGSGEIARLSLPSKNNNSSVLRKWAIAYDRRGNGATYNPRFEEIDEPPLSTSGPANPKLYFRTAYSEDGVDAGGQAYIVYKNGWQEFTQQDISVYWEDVKEKPTFGTLSKGNDVPVNTSANTKKKYIRINEGRGGVAVDNPQWEELDEPPWSSASESNPDCYVRTAYMVGTPPDHKYVYGWKKVNL